MPGIKHLIECHCYLAIYKNKEKRTNHKFPVYSKLDDYSNIIEKITKCNNCEALHKVTGVGVSELIPGKDQINSILKKEELAIMMPSKIANILAEYDSDISNYDHIIDIIEEKRWGEPVVIKREIINEAESVKIISVVNDLKEVKFSTEVIEKTIIGN